MHDKFLCRCINIIKYQAQKETSKKPEWVEAFAFQSGIGSVPIDLYCSRDAAIFGACLQLRHKSPGRVRLLLRLFFNVERFLAPEQLLCFLRI
jgi:hypothetical protein